MDGKERPGGQDRVRLRGQEVLPGRPGASRRRVDAGACWETLDARVYLLAANELRTAWRESIKAVERLEWSVFEEGGLGPNPELGYLNDDDPLVLAARSSVQRVFALAQAAAECA